MLAAAFCAVRAAALDVEISPDAVTIHVAPRAAVVLLSVAREPSYYMVRLVSRQEVLTDSDGDGRIRYVPPNGIAVSSIWIAVDVSRGDYAVAGPEGTRPLPLQPRGAGRGRAVEAIAGTLDVGRSAIDLLVVRPGSGVWFMAARDGSLGDHDRRRNGRLRLDLAALRPLMPASPAAPHALQARDVIAILDREAMEYAVVIVPGGGR